MTWAEPRFSHPLSGGDCGASFLEVRSNTLRGPQSAILLLFFQEDFLEKAGSDPIGTETWRRPGGRGSRRGVGLSGGGRGGGRGGASGCPCRHCCHQPRAPNPDPAGGLAAGQGLAGGAPREQRAPSRPDLSCLRTSPRGRLRQTVALQPGRTHGLSPPRSFC